MRAFAPTETPEEREARAKRFRDEAIQRKLEEIREAHQDGDGLVYVVSDWSDPWEPIDMAAFENRGDAEAYIAAYGGDPYEWRPVRVFKSTAAALKYEDGVR